MAFFVIEESMDFFLGLKFFIISIVYYFSYNLLKMLSFLIVSLLTLIILLLHALRLLLGFYYKLIWRYLKLLQSFLTESQIISSTCNLHFDYQTLICRISQFPYKSIVTSYLFNYFYIHTINHLFFFFFSYLHFHIFMSFLHP